MAGKLTTDAIGLGEVSRPGGTPFGDGVRQIDWARTLHRTHIHKSRLSFHRSIFPGNEVQH